MRISLLQLILLILIFCMFFHPKLQLYKNFHHLVYQFFKKSNKTDSNNKIGN